MVCSLLGRRHLLVSAPFRLQRAGSAGLATVLCDRRVVLTLVFWSSGIAKLWTSPVPSRRWSNMADACGARRSPGLSVTSKVIAPDFRAQYVGRLLRTVRVLVIFSFTSVTRHSILSRPTGRLPLRLCRHPGIICWVRHREGSRRVRRAFRNEASRKDELDLAGCSVPSHPRWGGAMVNAILKAIGLTIRV